MILRRTSVVMLLAACAAGCNKDYANPFQTPNPTATPGPDAALLVTSDVWSASPGAPRELYAVAADGGQLTRLTFCNAADRICDNSEVAVGRDPARVVIRRIPADSDRDGRLTPADGETAVYVDLERGVEGTLLPTSGGVSGIDWSPADDLLVFSGQTLGEPDDLFRMDVNGANNRQLTASPTIRERRPRIDPTGSVAVYERIGEVGPGQVWIFGSSTSQVQVTQGGTLGEALPGTLYRVGSDADPDYSPDGRRIVFRRLTALGSGGRGDWDLLTVTVEGIGLAVIAQGARYRGAPDWGPQGIVFEEVGEDGRASLVLLSPDDGTRRTLASVSAGYTLSLPRWLP
jgi:dipeptidyl aminopeptidase/acylaminoacyl peptidase